MLCGAGSEIYYHISMGNAESTTSHSINNNSNVSKQRRSDKSSASSKRKESSKIKTSSTDELTNMSSDTTDPITSQMYAVVCDIQAGLVGEIHKLEEQDDLAVALLDSMCSPYLDSSNIYKDKRLRTSYSEEEEDSRAVSEEETVTTDSYNRHNRTKNNNRNNNKRNHCHSERREDDAATVDSRSYVSENDTSLPPSRSNSNFNYNANRTNARTNYKSIYTRDTHQTNRSREESSYEETDEDNDNNISASEVTTTTLGDDDFDQKHAVLVSSKWKSSLHRKGNTTSLPATASTSAALVSPSEQPMASSFAKRCFFTKSRISDRTQHYEGLTRTGNVILMLASAMKLKCCPTICDEDLRRVEKTYPHQFSQLPDELLLSCGWRRTSKYCYFSNKPIPDGIPFFRTYLIFH